jgi:drug/metabolite transporter (DMT)-like permease
VSAIRGNADARPSAEGLLYGLIGMIIFGLTLPATRIAVLELDPFVVALGRGLVAGVLATAVVLVMRLRFPDRALWGHLVRYALNVVIVFPILMTVAMRYAPAAHGGVILAVLPLATAVASVVVAGERPSRAFWLAAIAGSAAVLVYAWLHGAGDAGVHWADLLLFAAVVAAAWGYAEGAMLSRSIGGWQAISWALTLTSPIMLVLTIVAVSLQGINWQASPAAWAGFAYVSVFSMFLGFFAWNRGLVLGGIAKVGQIQLLQTFVTLGGAAVLLGERIGPLELGFSVLVAAIVALGWRTRVARKDQAVP